MFFRILRSVGRGQHNNFLGGLTSVFLCFCLSCVTLSISQFLYNVYISLYICLSLPLYHHVCLSISVFLHYVYISLYLSVSSSVSPCLSLNLCISTLCLYFYLSVSFSVPLMYVYLSISVFPHYIIMIMSV